MSPRSNWVHGSSIDKKTGKIRYLSASQMNTAESCMRKWHWEKVSGKKPPDTEATNLGTECHAQIENYLETGQKTFGPIVMAGAFAIPDPGPDLLIEHDLLARLDQPGLVITEKNSQQLLDNAPLRAGGIPMLGFIDLVHFRGTNKGGSDVEQTRDPEGTVEVLDWKCLVAGTEVYDAGKGRRHDVSELGTLTVASVRGAPRVGDPLDQSALDVVTAEAKNSASGSKQCVQVTLKDGSKLEASHDHPILTARGWVFASKLRPGDLVLVSSKMPSPLEVKKVSDEEVKFVAYMLADGGCSQSLMQFTNMTPKVIKDWRIASEKLGYTITEDKTKSKARQFRLHGAFRNTKGDKRLFTDALRVRWNLYGLSKDKRAHADIWGLSAEQVALFLNRFFACDGYVGGHQIAVELSSEKLIDDLRFLLLRLGIRSRKHTRKTRAKTTKFRSWILTVGGQQALDFIAAVGLILGKEAACNRLKRRLESESRKPKNYAPAPKGLAWEQVTDVVSIGRHKVFDLDVPGTHTFFANSMVVHNTTSDFKWAKKGKNLIQTVQMSGYGKWVLNQKPDVTRVRLSHVYLRTRGAPAARKETHLFHPEEIHAAWEHADGIARLMATAATEPDSNKVDFNLDACSDYGGCIHRRYCTAGMDVGVAALIGRTQARKLEKAQGIVKPMGSLLSMANKKKSETGIDPAVLEAEKAKLVAQEKEAEIANRIPEGFREVVASIEALNVGFPKLTNKAARAYMALAGKDVPENYIVPGMGEYGYVEIEECQTMHDLYEELKSLPAKVEEETSPLPPDAPDSNPEIAAMDTEGNHIQAPTPPKTGPQAVDGVVSAVKKEKGPKAKAEKSEPKPPGPWTQHFSGINVFVDCIPSVPFTDLYDWCNQVADDMADNFPGTDDKGNAVATVDIRCAPKDTAIGFGKWEGLLSAVSRSEEHSPLAPGNYFIDTRGSRIREIIADGLRSRATLYVRTAR